MHLFLPLVTALFYFILFCLVVSAPSCPHLLDTDVSEALKQKHEESSVLSSGASVTIQRDLAP